MLSVELVRRDEVQATQLGGQRMPGGPPAVDQRASARVPAASIGPSQLVVTARTRPARDVPMLPAMSGPAAHYPGSQPRWAQSDGALHRLPQHR